MRPAHSPPARGVVLLQRTVVVHYSDQGRGWTKSRPSCKSGPLSSGMTEQHTTCDGTIGMIIAFVLRRVAPLQRAGAMLHWRARLVPD